MGPSVEAFGDGAVLITLPGEPSVETAARAQALARRIRASQGPWRGVVPAAASVLVHLDVGAVDTGATIRAVAALAADSPPEDAVWPADAASIEIPVRYGREAGPDLAAVGDATGLTPEQVIDAHASVAYRVLFLGFAPGFAYLGPLAPALVIPRRASPRVRVPAGSVAIAGPYAAVYPFESPGGWHVIGRTDLAIWVAARDRPAMLEPGAIVRFVPEAS